MNIPDSVGYVGETIYRLDYIVLGNMTPKMWIEIEHKIKFEDQEAHVISWLEATGGHRN